MAQRVVEKVVCYVVDDGRLLVFTHLAHPLTATGVQVPAGTIERGEDPAAAAERETLEETGLSARVVKNLGTAAYDLSPARNEVARRTFFQLALSEPAPERWAAGESSPATGGSGEAWECWWMPVAQGHVLAAGLGALIGRISA